MTEARGGLEAVRQAIIALLGPSLTDLADLATVLTAANNLHTLNAQELEALRVLMQENTAIPPGDVPPEQPQRYPAWWRLWAQDMAAKQEAARVALASIDGSAAGTYAWQEPIHTQIGGLKGAFEFWAPLFGTEATAAAASVKLDGIHGAVNYLNEQLLPMVASLTTGQTQMITLLSDLLECCQTGSPGATNPLFPADACPDYPNHYESKGYDLWFGNGSSQAAILLPRSWAHTGGSADIPLDVQLSEGPDGFSWFRFTENRTEPICIAWNFRPEWQNKTWKIYRHHEPYNLSPTNIAGSLLNTALGISGASGSVEVDILGDNPPGDHTYWYAIACEFFGPGLPETDPRIWVSFANQPV